jgi:hypothetical protein
MSAHAHHAADGASCLRQDAFLGPRRIIFGQQADLIKQLRTLLVIEKPAGNGLLGMAEATLQGFQKVLIVDPGGQSGMGGHRWGFLSERGKVLKSRV